MLNSKVNLAWLGLRQCKAVLISHRLKCIFGFIHVQAVSERQAKRCILTLQSENKSVQCSSEFPVAVGAFLSLYLISQLRPILNCQYLIRLY